MNSSSSNTTDSSTTPLCVAVFGHKGWIAGQFIPLLKEKGFQVLLPDIRADDPNALNHYFSIHKPTHVVSMIGRTHGPGCNTIDYLEEPGKLKENIRDNLYAPILLASLASSFHYHYTYLGTGCIYDHENPPSHPYCEHFNPNYTGSAYSTVKGFTDRMMQLYSNTLNVRIRMPISDEHHSRNFITKIVSYEKICSIPNSMTVLPSLLPILADMVLRKCTGTINLTNPGYITHNEILEMYQKHVEPDFTWKNFTKEEQATVLKSNRSNNVLDTYILETLYPEVESIHTAVLKCIQKLTPWK
jgi:3,5-epimerase/4-reductase